MDHDRIDHENPYAQIDDAQIDDASIICHYCGYNLTGVALGGRCPECGGAVADSLRQHVGGQGGSNGTAIACMVLGICSIAVCGLLGPVAIMMYYDFQKQVAAGTGDPNGMVMAKAGLITGWIATGLLLLLCVIYGVAFMLTGF